MDGSVAMVWESLKLPVLLMYKSLGYLTMQFKFNEGDLHAIELHAYTANSHRLLKTPAFRKQGLSNQMDRLVII